MLRRVQPALGLASPQGSFGNWRTLALPSPRSSAQRPRWLRTWQPSPCPPWPRAPPDAHPNSWASVPGGGRHPAVTRGTLTPNNPAGSLEKRLGPQGSGARGWVPCPAPCPTDVPHGTWPTVGAPAAQLTWPSCRMPCRGGRTRPGWACSRACGSCSRPTSSSACAPHSLQASTRPVGRGP